MSRYDSDEGQALRLQAGACFGIRFVRENFEKALSYFDEVILKFPDGCPEPVLSWHMLVVLDIIEIETDVCASAGDLQYREAPDESAAQIGQHFVEREGAEFTLAHALPSWLQLTTAPNGSFAELSGTPPSLLPATATTTAATTAAVGTIMQQEQGGGGGFHLPPPVGEHGCFTYPRLTQHAAQWPEWQLEGGIYVGGSPVAPTARAGCPGAPAAAYQLTTSPSWPGKACLALGGKANASFLRLLILKVICLPRQARDKHRESTQNKSGVFLPSLKASTTRWSACCRAPSLPLGSG